MKDLEKLKIEQVELKEKLLRLIDFMHGEEYSTLDATEKGLLASQRSGWRFISMPLHSEFMGLMMRVWTRCCLS